MKLEVIHEAPNKVLSDSIRNSAYYQLKEETCSLKTLEPVTENAWR